MELGSLGYVGFFNIKDKPLLSNENAMTDFHKTWYMDGGHRYYPRGLSSLNAHN